MPANVTSGVARQLHTAHPAHVGSLISPGGWRGRPFPSYALDNGRYARRAGGWEGSLFLASCDRAARLPTPPRWVAVPDVVGDLDATLREWDTWAYRLRRLYGWALAFVWQDGATPDLVRRHTDADVQFIGGSTRYKWRATPLAAATFARVHVGRVNTVELGLRCFRAGVESIDGTGWCMTTRQRRGLTRLVELVAAGEQHDPALPLELFA